MHPMQETLAQSLGWEDPLEKETAAHSSILAWRTPWTEEPGGLQSVGSQRVRHDLATKQQQTTHCCFKMIKRNLIFAAFSDPPENK